MFSLIFILGCNFPGGGGGSNVSAATGEVSKGTFNASILVNGMGTSTMSLLSEQSAQIGLQIKNIGSSDLKDVKALLIGCIEGKPNKDNITVMYPNTADYLSWTVQAPPLSQSEVINCPLTIRICYDKNSSGYTELKFIPDQYTEAPEPANSFSDSDVLSISFNFPVIRVLNTSANDITGSLTITNIGPGWVDYSNYSVYPNLSINTIKSLTINLSANKVAITKLRDISGSDLSKWLSNGGKLLTLTTKNAGSDISLLKLVQGKELYLPLRLNVTNASIYQSAPKTELLDVTIEHGYCLDIATIQTTLRGR